MLYACIIADNEDGGTERLSVGSCLSKIPSATVMYMRVLAVYGKRFGFKYWKMSDACIQER